MPRRTQVTLRLSQILLREAPLKTRFQEFLMALMEVSGLPLQAKGALFLKEGETLRLVVEHNLDEPLKVSCATLPLGRCLCGRVGHSGEAHYSPLATNCKPPVSEFLVQDVKIPIHLFREKIQRKAGVYTLPMRTPLGKSSTPLRSGSAMNKALLF